MKTLEELFQSVELEESFKKQAVELFNSLVEERVASEVQEKTEQLIKHSAKYTNEEVEKAEQKVLGHALRKIEEVKEEVTETMVTHASRMLQEQCEEIENNVLEHSVKYVQELKESHQADIDKMIKYAAKREIGLIENIDGYLSHVAEQWIQENELALEKGMKSQLFEDILSELKTSVSKYKSVNIDEAVDVLGQLQDQKKQLQESLKQITYQNKKLQDNINESKKGSIINKAVRGLNSDSASQFRVLAEETSYVNESSFTKQMKQLRGIFLNESKQSRPTHRTSQVNNQINRNLNESIRNPSRSQQQVDVNSPEWIAQQFTKLS